MKYAIIAALLTGAAMSIWYKHKGEWLTWLFSRGDL